MSLAICTPTTSKKISAKKKHKSQEAMILESLPLVKFLAQRLQSRLPASIEIDDLVSAGVLGLMDAAEKFEQNRGLQFSTYARQRINGAMLDYLRDLDWAPRSIRRKSRDMKSAVDKVERELGRPASDEEIAVEMNISLNQYYKLTGDLKGAVVGSFESAVDRADNGSSESIDMIDLVADPMENSPYHQFERTELREQLAAAIDKLSEKQRLVMSLYYYEELSMLEIASILNVNESRISQIHSAAVKILRNKLRALGCTRTSSARACR
jgi:RNA polymerase sigma factor for flagellar operon FliA